MVDDSLSWRHFLSAVLLCKSDWNIVGEASDGLDAAQKAKELEPDLILLDVGLPGLNGIEVAQQISQLGLKSKILFLSGLSNQEIAQAALGTGAGGYVYKFDAGRELVSAIEAVLQGKRFVSSGVKGCISADAEDTQAFDSIGIHRHEVQFYSDDAVFLESVTRFIAGALDAGNAAIVFATTAHQEGLLDQLRAQGVDVETALQQGAYASLDATHVLSTFMVDDRPDASRFTEDLGNLVQLALRAATAKHPRVAIFGEGVALMWAAGKKEAALRMEQLCNEIVETHPVDILCAYPFSLQIQENEAAFNAICAEHSAAYSA